MNVAELSSWIEEKVAPEPLIAIQALANSRESYDSGEEEEKLTGPAATGRWLTDFGLARRGIVVSEADQENLIELRRCIRALIDANMTGNQDGAANAELARIAALHPVPVGVAGDGSVGLDLEPAESVDALIAQLIGIVMQAQINGTWGRLKICAADTCRWAFFDGSKNRGGHWCSMELCGNRVKNRAYRERQAATS